MVVDMPVCTENRCFAYPALWWFSEAYKRPVGQNLWGRDKSVVDFEVKVFGVVWRRRREPTRFQSFSGQSRFLIFPRAHHVANLPHPKRPLLTFCDMTRKIGSSPFS